MQQVRLWDPVRPRDGGDSVPIDPRARLTETNGSVVEDVAGDVAGDKA